MHDIPVLLFLGAIYALTAYLILYQIEIRLRIVARIKCRLGYHKRTYKELGKIVTSHRCVHCKKSKSNANLTLIEGGKKDIGSTFKF